MKTRMIMFATLALVSSSSISQSKCWRYRSLLVKERAT
jgi:hypothetical protein